MTVATHPLADDYLRSLDRAARGLRRNQRIELVAEIRSHLDAGLAPDASEADVRNLLDALGPPADIVAAAQPDRVPTRRGAREVFALILLVTGFPPLFGWFVGAGLLLSSPLWSARQKVLGLLVWPGGYLGVLYIRMIALPEGGGRSCRASTDPSGGISQMCATDGLPGFGGAAISIVVFVAPLLVAAYLYRAAGKHERLV